MRYSKLSHKKDSVFFLTELSKNNNRDPPPRGYAKDHPAIHLLRYKQFMLRHLFSDEEVLSPDFLIRVNDVFKKMRPFLDFMSGVLTTDVNGVDVVD